MKATGTVVSVRRVGPEGRGGNPANWPVVFGMREVPPPSTPRFWEPRPATAGTVLYATDPFTLPALPPGDYRLELWRGSATTDGNYPDSPPIWEWGREASDFGPSNAVVFFEVAGSPPPPPPPAGPDIVGALAQLRKAREHLMRAKSTYGEAKQASPGAAFARTHPGMCEQAILNAAEALSGQDGG